MMTMMTTTMMIKINLVTLKLYYDDNDDKHYTDENEINLVREAINKKKVTFLWTLSVPPLAPPPPGLRTLRGVFFLKARTSDSRRLERKNA